MSTVLRTVLEGQETVSSDLETVLLGPETVLSDLAKVMFGPETMWFRVALLGQENLLLGPVSTYSELEAGLSHLVIASLDSEVVLLGQETKLPVLGTVMAGQDNVLLRPWKVTLLVTPGTS
jgi:hypothetical protein